MEDCRAAERALVTALVLGDADPAEFGGRVRAADFTDPAAGVLFEVVMSAAGGWSAEELPAVLQRRGLLRRDGYPISELLTWLPKLSVPVHAQAWATLVVAGALGRQVYASGVRLQQAAVAGLEDRYPPGQVLAMVAAQQAALAGSRRRWEDLPVRWRATLSADPFPAELHLTGRAEADGADAEPAGAGRERELLAGLVAAPQLLGRIAWLAAQDFTDPSCAVVFNSLRRLQEAGHAVDVVTVSAACDPAPPRPGLASPAALAAELRPEQAMPTAVPFLARQVLAHAISRDVHRVGEELVQLAAAPAARGGVGSALLTAARDRLERLRPHAVRLEKATSESRPSGPGRSLVASPARLPSPDRLRPEAVVSLDRHAG